MDAPIPDLYNEKPLLVFSLYTQNQKEILERKASTLREISKSWNGGTICNAIEYYDDFWFWVLGAYEVLRTMDQHTHCFSSHVGEKTKDLKSRLAVLRVPFAKQELKGRKGPVNDELSVTGFGQGTHRGLTFEIQGTVYNSTEIIDEITCFLDKIRFEDVLAEIPRGNSP